MAEPRILLVEDEPIVAMSFAAILQEEGYEVVGPVGSIDQALEIIAGSAIPMAHCLTSICVARRRSRSPTRSSDAVSDLICQRLRA
jgi:CheY-like chemotaxis protein